MSPIILAEWEPYSDEGLFEAGKDCERSVQSTGSSEHRSGFVFRRLTRSQFKTDRLSRSHLKRVDERLNGIFAHLKTDHLLMTGRVEKIDRQIVRMAFRQQKKQTAGASQRGENNGLADTKMLGIPVNHTSHFAVRDVEDLLWDLPDPIGHRVLVPEGEVVLIKSVESASGGERQFSDRAAGNLSLVAADACGSILQCQQQEQDERDATAHISILRHLMGVGNDSEVGLTEPYAPGVILVNNWAAVAIRYSGWTMALDLPDAFLDVDAMETHSHFKMAALDPIQFTRELVEIESTTYHEGKVGDFLAEFLSGRGWLVEKMEVPQPGESKQDGARWNVYGGPAEVAPELVFSTHMDTVPPYIPFSEDDEFIYGRGVCDAKGIIAAQVAAAERLRAEGYAVGLLFVSGEERDSAGAKVANENAKGSRYLINGEPTDNRLALASKGALRIVLTATGKMGHSAYPELGESAIHKLVEVLRRVLELELPVVEDVGPSTLNIGQFHGGRAPNVIADHAEAQILLRLVGDSAETRLAIEKCAEGLAEVDFTLEIPFVRLKAVEGIPTMVAKFTTDIPQLSKWGEPLLLGPGSILLAHTPHEKLAKKELLEAVDLYVSVAKQLLDAD
jgi:acetylornithine deacetylase